MKCVQYSGGYIIQPLPGLVLELKKTTFNLCLYFRSKTFPQTTEVDQKPTLTTTQHGEGGLQSTSDAAGHLRTVESKPETCDERARTVHRNPPE